jgi:ATP-dependent DNA ligase
MLYDVFVGEGQLLLEAPFQDRRHLLACVLRPHLLVAPDSALGLPCHYRDSFREFFFKLIQDEEIEGLVLKDLGGRLRLGRTKAAQSSWMWKVRRPSGSYQF